MRSPERECLRRLAALQLVLGTTIAAAVYWHGPGAALLETLKPSLFGAVLAVAAVGLLMWRPLWQKNDSKRALAMLIETGADLAGAAPLAEADVRSAAAMLGTDWIALLLRERNPRGGLTYGDLHVLQRGAYKVQRVPLGEEDLAGAGFVAPPGIHLPDQILAKPLMGQYGELGRIVIAPLAPPPGSTVSPSEQLLALLSAWWSMRLDNRRLAADAEARLLDIVESLITSVEAKDPYTSGHSKRVCKYSELIAVEMGFTGRELEEIAIGAALHDVGKLGIPEQVLRKPAKLDDEEWELMRSHPKVGARIIDSFNQSPAVLHMIFHHHEHWNGNGYPSKLAAEAIPLPARIVGVADALDAMTSARSYQRNRTVADALEELRRSAGRQFDPKVVDAIFRVPLPTLEAIAPKVPPAPAEVPVPVVPAPAPALGPVPTLIPAPVPVVA